MFLQQDKEPAIGEVTGSEKHGFGIREWHNSVRRFR